MIKKILKALAGLLVLLTVAAIAVYVATGPRQPPAGSASAMWLQDGPYNVGEAELMLTDSSRPTPANRGVAGRPDRRLPVTLWFPEQDAGPHPLIVHSHGILSNRRELAYLARALASRGYVVAALDFPLSSGAAEGGATPDDVGSQPGDVAFVIDSVLALGGASQPFAGSIDAQRIGITGYSLGGLTTYLTAYHPGLRDTRVRAAAAIAGLSAAFSPAFFANSDMPFLAVSGTADALLEFERNAGDLPARNARAAVLRIDGGTHLGFLGVADPMFRFMDNPDTLGCQGVLSAVGDNPNRIYASLGGAAEGIDMQRELPQLCNYGFPPAAHPGRQRMITQLAVVAFFESVFNADEEIRQSAESLLHRQLSQDFREAAYSGRF